MGAWGTGAFDNDGALDWVWELEGGGITAIESALDEAVRSSDLSAPTDVEAIAAAEVVAAAIGRPLPGLSDEIAALVTHLVPSVTPSTPRGPHRRRAGAQRLRALRALEETDDADDWRGLVEI